MQLTNADPLPSVRMGLPEKRVSELLSRAMRAIPMPADLDPVEVAYEDKDLIAVIKPPGRPYIYMLIVTTDPKLKQRTCMVLIKQADVGSPAILHTYHRPLSRPHHGTQNVICVR